jgi:hypothetical protein
MFPSSTEEHLILSLDEKKVCIDYKFKLKVAKQA